MGYWSIRIDIRQLIEIEMLLGFLRIENEAPL
jgi:hypothetical protein